MIVQETNLWIKSIDGELKDYSERLINEGYNIITIVPTKYEKWPETMRLEQALLIIKKRES